MGAETESLGLFQWAVQIGGPMGALLIVFGYFYRKDMKETAAKAEATQKQNAEQYREDVKFYTDQMKQVSDEWKGQTGALMTIVRENSAALAVNATSNAQLTAVVKSLHEHMLKGDRRQFPRTE